MHLGGSHFLLVDSYRFFEHQIRLHPIAGPLLLLALFAVIVGILKRIFGRLTIDVLLFAVIICTITIIFGSSIFTFFHIKGFHFGG